MAKRWSKLQKQIYRIIDTRVPLQIHCLDVTKAPGNGSLNHLGLYQVRLGKLLIWNFPKQFVSTLAKADDGGNGISYCVSDLNKIVREYLDTQRDALPEKSFDNDLFGLTDILKAADRRLGAHRLKAYFKTCENPAIMNILKIRFNKPDTDDLSSSWKGAVETI